MGRMKEIKIRLGCEGQNLYDALLSIANRAPIGKHHPESGMGRLMWKRMHRDVPRCVLMSLRGSE